MVNRLKVKLLKDDYHQGVLISDGSYLKVGYFAEINLGVKGFKILYRVDLKVKRQHYV